MKKEIIEKLKEKLEKEKKEIEEVLKRIAKEGKIPEDWEAKFPHYGEESGMGIEEKSADQVEEYEALRATEQTLEVKLRDIKLALKKIKKGNYGMCESCGKKIELKRLKTLPETRFCKRCKK